MGNSYSCIWLYIICSGPRQLEQEVFGRGQRQLQRLRAGLLLHDWYELCVCEVVRVVCVCVVRLGGDLCYFVENFYLATYCIKIASCIFLLMSDVSKRLHTLPH
jgi:hypothetical protein